MTPFHSLIGKPQRILTSVFTGTMMCMVISAASAEPPHLASHWEPTGLSSRACLEHGIAVLHEMGFQDAHLGKSGKVVFGNRDDSHMEVICSIPHWVVFVGASSSLDQIVKYRDILVERF